MDENKEIEKLSETGGQSAEMVSGGVDEAYCHPRRPIKNPRNIKCVDCGKSIILDSLEVFRKSDFVYHEGKWYCSICLAKHKAIAEELAPSADAGLSN